MKKITIIQLITFLNSILIYNSIFYEVTTDIYNKEFTNLDSYIKHIFVIPVNNMDDDIYYGFKINKITQDVFQDIEALHYETDYEIPEHLLFHCANAGRNPGGLFRNFAGGALGDLPYCLCPLPGHYGQGEPAGIFHTSGIWGEAGTVY